MKDPPFSESGSCPVKARRIPDSESLADTVGFRLLGSGLGKDVESALQFALRGGAVLANGHDALSIFRQVLKASIRDIELHPRGKLFRDFLLKGPYDHDGEIPTTLVGERLSDADTSSAIAFFFSGMFNSIKGSLTELLAVKPCLYLMRRLKEANKLPQSARLFVGDSVGIHRATGKGLLKGADLHILIEEPRPDSASRIIIAGVAEVKSYIQSESRLRDQINRHLHRVKQGLQVIGVDYPTEKVTIGYGKGKRIIRIAVLPSSWKLPRSFRFEDSEGGRLLHVDPGEPPELNDKTTQTGDNEWRIILRWSKEALAEASIEMTLWYLGKISEIICSQHVPETLRELTPTEAGRQAAKIMLYYAILRSRTACEKQRAIALHNSYGYGYALGMNFRNAEGRREMLWPQDLNELFTLGKTKNGCVLS